MLIKSSDVIDKKVYTVDTGKEITKVSDVVYDPKQNRVVGFLSGVGGIFSEPKLIFMDDIVGIGKDAILVKDESAVKDLKETGQNVTNIAEGDKYLTKTKVITEDGVDLGKVSDILFDPETGQAEELEVTQGLNDIKSGRKYVNVSDIVTVGKDATIVSSYTDREFDQQAQNQGLEGAVNRASQKTSEVMEDVQVKGGEASSALQQKTKDMMDNNKRKDWMNKAKDKLREAGDKTKEEIDKMESKMDEDTNDESKDNENS